MEKVLKKHLWAYIFLIIFFFGCKNELKEGSLKAIPNSVCIMKYNEDSILVRKTICQNEIPKYQMINKNDTIIEYFLVRVDTIIGKDSIGEYKATEPIYKKKVSFNKTILFDGLGNTSDVSAHDCVNCE